MQEQILHIINTWNFIYHYTRGNICFVAHYNLIKIDGNYGNTTVTPHGNPRKTLLYIPYKTLVTVVTIFLRV